MKTKFNILLVITLFTITLFSSFAYANEITKHISIKEYERILKAEYAKYGVEMKVLDYDENKNITRDVLNDELAKVEYIANSFKVTDVYNNEPINFSISSLDVIAPLGIFYNKTVFANWIISNAYGNANMRSEANVTIDGGNSNIVSINSKSTYQVGSFINFDNWTTTSMVVTPNSPSTGYIKMDISGRATFSYADPYTGIKTGYTSLVNHKILQVNCI